MIDGEHRWKILKSNGVLKLQYIKHPNVKTEAERAILRQYYNKISGKHEKYLDELDVKRIYEADMLEEFSVSMDEPIDDFQRRLKQTFDIQFGAVENMNIVSLPKKTNIHRGDLFKLGDHTLMCGDCRIQSDVDNLLQDNRVDSLQTDPPYGVEYAKKNEFLNEADKGNRIQTPMVGDDLKDLRAYLRDAFKIIPFKEFNTVYIWMAGNRTKDLIGACEDAGITLSRGGIVWIKNNHVLSRLDHQQKHELCQYGWKGKHKWLGGNGTTMSVYNYDKPLLNAIHPTQKPLELIEE
ncbi:MAG: site-specific DNA-methyltransferase, partial [Nitrospinae bacterium]|nr:site-specific DNA-methyltransferase [Nitrospinota bacterium]